MIIALQINGDATLNSFFYIGSTNYSSGESLTVAFQFANEQKDIRFIPNVAAVVNVVYIDTDGVEQTKAATNIDADDRSLWSITFTPAETALIGGSTLRIEMDELNDGTIIHKMLLDNSIIKQVISGNC